MIVRVLRCAELAGAGPVAVAAGDPEIVAAVQAAGGRAVLTDPRLPSAPKTARGLRASLPPAAATQEAAAPTRTLAGSNPAPQERPVEASSPANPEPAEIRAAMLAPADTARESPPGERPSALSGDWVFVPAAGATKSRYAPEFIELRLRERP